VRPFALVPANNLMLKRSACQTDEARRDALISSL
jgi:hypothetical protein